MPLVLCNACSRHVRDTETRCPFCDSEVAVSEGRVAAPPRMSRAAQVAFVATVLVGCRDESKPPVTPTETIDAQSPEPPPPPPPPPNLKKPYGAPPADGLLT